MSIFKFSKLQVNKVFQNISFKRVHQSECALDADVTAFGLNERWTQTGAHFDREQDVFPFSIQGWQHAIYGGINRKDVASIGTWHP